MHPAVRKAKLRRLLTEHPVMTSVSLARLGLEQAAGWMDYPRIDLDVRTQSHQASSITTLTFVSREEQRLTQAPRDLLHQALLAEGALRLADDINAQALQFTYLTLKGRQGMWPDAELRSPHGRAQDVAVEVDTGYNPERVDAKLIGFAAAGYQRLIWLTSVHGRVEKLDSRVYALHAQGKLTGLKQARTMYVDVHRPGDPYAPRPRLNKISERTATFDR